MNNLIATEDLTRPRPKAWRIHGIAGAVFPKVGFALASFDEARFANSFDEARFALARLQKSECGIVLL